MELYLETPDLIYLTQNRDPYASYISRKIFSAIDLRKKGRLLDMGCGTGRNTILAAQLGLESVGIDYENKAVDIAKKQIKRNGLEGKVSFIRKNLFSLKPRQYGMFDYCILEDVLEHVQDYQKLIRVAYANLKKGGKLIITVPHDPAQWTILDDYAMHVRRFRKNELQKALHAFTSVSITVIGFPFHRMVCTAYDIIMRIKKMKHQPKLFRANRTVLHLYNIVGSTLLRIDDWFIFTQKGTALIAVAVK